MGQWVKGSMGQWVKGSRDQWVNGSMGQGVKGSMGQWVNGSRDQGINGSRDQWVNGSRGQGVKGSMGQWVKKSRDQGVPGSRSWIMDPRSRIFGSGTWNPAFSLCFCRFSGGPEELCHSATFGRGSVEDRSRIGQGTYLTESDLVGQHNLSKT